MINKLKIFTMATLLTGATVTSTRATVTTNMQVLNNLSVQLKIYRQGPLSSTGKSLAATPTTFTTSDLIQQLAPFAGFSYSRGQKLVYSTIYSKSVVGTPNTTLTNLQVTNLNGLGANISLQIVDPGGTNGLPITSGVNSGSNGFTNFYLITNATVWQLTNSNTPLGTYSYYTNILNDIILTNGIVVATINTNSMLANSGPSLGYWTTIVPTITAISTNITITQYSPQTNIVFTNANSHICVLTPKTSTAAASLVDVDNWLGLYQSSDFNGNNFAVYKESGNDLSGGDFQGTNITGQTLYSSWNFYIFAAWPTNSAPPGQTNLIFSGDHSQSDTPLSGLGTSVTRLINLTMNGNAREKAVFQTIGSATIPVTAVGYIGGTLTTNTLQTNTFNGVTTTNNTFGSSYTSGFGNWVGTNFIYQNNGNNLYIQNVNDVLAEGTITINFLSAKPVIAPVAP